jgi:SPP1 gp7 family putative phage head morphogenesis protein
MSTHNHKGACYAENLSLRNDPTKTLSIRQNFEQDIRGRFRRVNGAIRRTIGYENDAFGLSQNKIDAPESFDFPTDSGKIQAFQEALKTWLQTEILEPATFSEIREGEHWTSDYIKEAYVKSRNVAIGRLKQAGVSVENIPDTELAETRTSINTLQSLYTRTYENLEDITEDMAGVIREELTRGFAEGRNPKAMADSITKEVKTIQRTRAETLARTETIRAASEGTLDEYERSGIQAVGHGDWQTAMDTDVCPFCRRLNGETFSLSEFRANHAVVFRGQTYRLMPPAHPNGRCVIRPAVGVDPSDLAPLQERVPGRLVS